MGERNRGRDAVEQMASVFKKHEEQRTGRILTSEQAKAVVLPTARLEDARADQGHNKNRNRGQK